MKQIVISNNIFITMNEEVLICVTWTIVWSKVMFELLGFPVMKLTVIRFTCKKCYCSVTLKHSLNQKLKPLLIRFCVVLTL